MQKKLTYAFFGGEPLGVPILEKLYTADLIPELVVCNPDRPQGREHTPTPPPLKSWALDRGLEIFQPTNYRDGTAQKRLTAQHWDIFVVVAYNFILPDWLIALPAHGSLNVHPSLLPKLRGASPIRSAILQDATDALGVSIILMDEAMDHGPILVQQPLSIKDTDWPLPGPELDKRLANLGGEVLLEILPKWIDGRITPQTQDHAAATYSSKFTKADSEMAIDPHALPTGEAAATAWRTINAFAGIGDTYFVHQGKRIKIKQATLTPQGSLQLIRVIPEGKKEVAFADYLNSLAR